MKIHHIFTFLQQVRTLSLLKFFFLATLHKILHRTRRGDDESYSWKKPAKWNWCQFRGQFLISYFSYLLDIKDQLKQIEKSVVNKEPRYLSRVLRSLGSTRKKLNDTILSNLLSTFSQSGKYVNFASNTIITSNIIIFWHCPLFYCAVQCYKTTLLCMLHSKSIFVYLFTYSRL